MQQRHIPFVQEMFLSEHISNLFSWHHIAADALTALNSQCGKENKD